MAEYRGAVSGRTQGPLNGDNPGRRSGSPEAWAASNRVEDWEPGLPEHRQRRHGQAARKAGPFRKNLWEPNSRGNG